MDKLAWILGGVALVTLILLFTGCTTVGKPMRFDPKTHGATNAWYVEGKATNGTTFSCSFVEFDGRGDYIDFKQHTNAWRKVKELAEAQKILLVFYCHGWKNNSQSGDVLQFNEFLGRLSASSAVGGEGYRVHGVYLSWRGNLFHPYVSKGGPDTAFSRTEKAFSSPIVDKRYQRAFRWTWWIPEQLSYWSRRNAAEDKVSGVPIVRTIFTCASLVKSIDETKERTGIMNSSRVMLMGHSFGALLVERALSATCLDPLTDLWSWFEQDPALAAQRLRKDGGKTETQYKLEEANPLPLDFVLLVNSAAPAIYSKMMRDFLTAHSRALDRAKSPYADTPIFVSVTSSADKATRMLHPIANVFAPLYPSLQHRYDRLLKFTNDTPPRPVHQSAFFNRTSGHHPLLIDHWIVTNGPVVVDDGSNDSIFYENLNYGTENPLEFRARLPKSPPRIQDWKLTIQVPPEERAWARRFGAIKSNRSAYWLVRCNKKLIRNHNDVWSDSAMQLYAALYRLVEWTRITEPEKVQRVFDDYWKTVK